MNVTTMIMADNNTVFSYKDNNGNTIVSNIPHSGSKEMSLPEVPVYVRPMTKSDFMAKKYTNRDLIYNNIKLHNQPSKNIDNNTSKNSIGRQQILTEELKHEQDALNTTQALLNDAKYLSSKDPKSYNNRIKILNDAITEHQKNIEILTKQLQN